MPSLEDLQALIRWQGAQVDALAQQVITASNNVIQLQQQVDASYKTLDALAELAGMKSEEDGHENIQQEVQHVR